jgi:hypothetical protein
MQYVNKSFTLPTTTKRMTQTDYEPARLQMTVEELKAAPAFVTLGTDQQREWVVAYCSNGADKIKATEAAYACNDTASAVAIANRNLRHPAIKRS